MRSPEEVTQVQRGVPINVGNVREGEGKETRCESTGGCETKGDIRSGGALERMTCGAARTPAGKESDELRSFSAPAATV